LTEFKKEKLDLPNAIIGGLVFFITLYFLLRTVSPTMSFWDCGEFVACSAILGIAHPPGFPLYLLIGRIFAAIPFAEDVAYRVNLLSVISASFMALFGYLVVVRLIRKWYDDRQDRLHRIIAYAGGFSGSLFATFNTTNWSNSVEAEVYALTMAMMLAIYWLALKYNDFKETFYGTRAMILALFLGMLGIGVHMTIYLVMPVIALYIILKKDAGNREWGLVTLLIVLELYLIFALSSKPGEIPYYIPIAITTMVYIFHLAMVARYSAISSITLFLSLLALYPFYFVLINSAAGGGEMSEGLKSTMNIPIGWIGFVCLAIWGIYSAYRRFFTKTSEVVKYDLQLAAIYSLSPILLFGMGEIFHGYHAFLGLSALLIVLLAISIWKRTNILIFIAIVGMSMIILGFYQFIYGLIGGTILILVLAKFMKTENWRVAVSIILLAAIGFSVHLFIPIRSSLNPSIDENDPSSSTKQMVGYLERKQYGSESMTERMFSRRGEWENQFGDYRRMGFWRFFKEQYGFQGPWFVVVLILGVFGIWETIRRKPQLGLPLMLMILICTVGLVLYMNFADGTRMIGDQDYIEVRDRDYFFTPGFIFFGLAIGLGVAAFIDLVKDTFSGGAKQLKYVMTGAACLLAFLPAAAISSNYFKNDRSNNYMAYDYARNLMMTCNENAILITNGDNDTFPIWCIQEAYGYRQDVKSVNLSLANLAWYIKQLRDFKDLPISWNDDQIDRLRPYISQDGLKFRIQDQLVDELLIQNRWRNPVHITVTTPDDNRKFKGKSLDEFLVLDGLVFTMSREQGKNRLNLDKTRELVLEKYSYRSIADSTVYKDEASIRIANNYAQIFMWMADTMRIAGNNEQAMEYILKGIERIPMSYELYGYGAQLLSDMGKEDSIDAFLEPVPDQNKKELYYRWGLVAAGSKRFDVAAKALQRAYALDPDYTDAFKALASVYYHLNDLGSLKEHIRKWLVRHPDDTEAVQLLKELEKMPALPLRPDTPQGNNE